MKSGDILLAKLRARDLLKYLLVEWEEDRYTLLGRVIFERGLN